MKLESLKSNYKKKKIQLPFKLPPLSIATLRTKPSTHESSTYIIVQILTVSQNFSKAVDSKLVVYKDFFF